MKRKIVFKKQTIILLVIFIAMLFLNFLTPLLADDFTYSFGINGRITSINDIILNQINHYLTWGGRTVAHFIAQLFLLGSKTVFNVSNSLAFTLLTYLIYKHCTKEDKPLLLIIVFILLWFLIPAFGENCLWLIGSCNYLWTTNLILALLLPYRNDINSKDSIIKTIGIFLLGIFAGWTNENTSFAMIIIIIVMMLQNKKKEKNNLKKWHLSGLIGSIIGFLILVLAPGNYKRLDTFIESSFIIKYSKRILKCIVLSLDYLIPAIAIIIILIAIIIYFKKKKINYCFIPYLIGTFCGISSMVASPLFPVRALFGVTVFLIITIIILLKEVLNIHKAFTYIVACLVIISSMIMFKDYLYYAKELVEYKQIWEYRIEYIEEQKQKGIYDIEVPGYSTNNRRSPIFEIGDITNDETNWLNISISDYYEIKTIKTKQK